MLPCSVPPRPERGRRAASQHPSQKQRRSGVALGPSPSLTPPRGETRPQEPGGVGALRNFQPVSSHNEVITQRRREGSHRQAACCVALAAPRRAGRLQLRGTVLLVLLLRPLQPSRALRQRLQR